MAGHELESKGGSVGQITFFKEHVENFQTDLEIVLLCIHSEYHPLLKRGDGVFN